MQFRLPFVCLLFTFLSLFFLNPAPAHACLWDRDTLAEEAKGVPEVVDVITGWFDRNPPLYYQMRLDRVSAQLAKDPADLDAYDDAAVACDRLGRDDEAIAWMDRKLLQLQRLPPRDPHTLDERYRYLANTGTFWVHRWIHNGADRAKIEQVKKARDFLVEAVKLNPDAHFGREKYQIMALEWMIDPPVDPDNPRNDSNWVLVPDFLGFRLAHRSPLYAHTKIQSFASQVIGLHDLEKTQALEAAQKGLCGLIVLGNAWESVDVFYALGWSLREQWKANMVRLVQLRISELIQNGGHSLYPSALQGKSQGEIMVNALRFLQPEDSNAIEKFYRAARAAADSRNKARQEFMLARLQQGRHPDTDPTFWDGYVEPQHISMPGPPWYDRLIGGHQNRRKLPGIIFVAALSLAAVLFIIKSIRPRANEGSKPI